MITVGNFTATPKMKALLTEVLESGIISYGPKSRAFEAEFAARHGSRYALLSNSGTSSLQVGLQALYEVEGWKPGDQVIVPATTFVATANVVRHLGLTPVFVDVSPKTFNLDRELIKIPMPPRARAVIPVHLLGLPSDIEGLKSYLAFRGADLKIMEDSCEAMLATHHGAPVGSLGDVAAFSTYVAHILVTGVGGLTTTSNPAYAGKIRSLLNHGLELAQLNPDENFSPRPMKGRRFMFDTYGHSFRMTEMEAALGLAQLETLEAEIAIRRRNAARYIERLQALNERYDAPFAWQITPAANTHAYMMFGIVLREGRTAHGPRKESLTAALQAADIETRDIPTLLGQKVYRDLEPRAYPVSAWLMRSGFYVGCHPGLSLDEIDYVCDSIARWIAK